MNIPNRKSPKKRLYLLFYAMFFALVIVWVPTAHGLTPSSRHHVLADARGHCTCQFSLLVLLLSAQG